MSKDISIEQCANHWHIRVQEGLSVTEQSEFEAWLAIEAHYEAYEATQRLIGGCLALDDAFIRALEAEIMHEGAIVHASSSQAWYKKRFFSPVLAACFILFLGVVLRWYYFEPTFSQSYATSNQKMLGVALPDASKMDIDIKSSLHVKYFNHKRTVDFTEGKVIFSVSKDSQKPFRVQTGGTKIEVVGTKFEVLHVNDLTTVSVLEGIVNVSNQTDNAVYRLTKAQSITFNEAGKVLNYGQINPQKIGDWKEDMLFFDATTLSEAATQFAYYTHQPIEFENDTIASLKISGKFHTAHFQGFLEAIEAIYGLRANTEKENIRIVKK